MLTEIEISAICREAFEKENIRFNIPVKINGRLKRTLGLCRYEVVGGAVRPTSIEISRDLLASENHDQIRETIIHECAHAIVTLQTGEKHGHDDVWKATCQRLGIAGNRCASVPASKDYKYNCLCTTCGKILKRYYRAGEVVKHPENYFCKTCGGPVTIEQLF